MKKFPEYASVEWIRFVFTNRDHRLYLNHEYDIVIGPIADDGVVLQLNKYRDKILEPEEAAKHLQGKFLDQQYYFGTEKALKLLKKLEVWKID